MIYRIFQILYILIALAVLAITLTTYAPGPNSDIMLFFNFAMLILAFPSSLAVIGLMALLILLQELSGLNLINLMNDYVGITLLWFVLFIAGYLQWFVALPWLWKKLKKPQKLETGALL